MTRDKAKKSAYDKEYRARKKAEDPEGFKYQERLKMMRHWYRITNEQYEEMIAGGCLVCGTTEGKLTVDHNHECCKGPRTCGKCVRGVLCHSCNVSEGHLGNYKTALDLAVYMTQDIDIKEVLQNAGQVSFA